MVRILCLLLLANTVLAQEIRRPPNIIFILADDLGWGELGCYGNQFNETPNLDKLAKQGMQFMQAYSAAPICSPARAGFITGQYPARTRITDFLPAKTNRWLNPSKYITINEALAKAGYHSAILGKWHLDTDYQSGKGSPQAHGFNEVIGSETKYIADGDYFFPYDKISTYTTGTDNEYLTDRQCTEAVRFIERNKEKPFFLYLPFYAVHTKLDAPEELVNKYKKKFDSWYGAGAAEHYYGAHNVRHESEQGDNPYLAAMIERIDAGVGAIMQALDATGLAENTLLIFFSDNGAPGKVGTNGHLRAGKGWLYEGGIRECLLMRWPGHIQPNTVTHVPVSGIDFYPTFLEIAGVKNVPGNRVDGVSILPLITKNKAPKREALYWHYPSETGRWKPRMATAVRKNNYKLIQFYQDNRLELYNLHNDPSEKKNLAADMPGKTRKLKVLLEKWKKEVNAEIPDMSAVKPAAK